MFDSFLRTLIALIAAVACLAAPARAAIEIDITQGNIDPLALAVPDFLGETEETKQIGADMAGVIINNLERSGLFKAIDQRAYIEKIEDVNVMPKFADWRIINAQALITGQTTVLPDGRLRVEFRLWDVFANQQMLGLQYATTPENWRRIAHIVSDAIYKRLTGEEGYFDTRIVFVHETGPKLDRVKRLMIMDQDGHNPSALTDGTYLVLTPRFSPTLQQITYLSYAAVTPQVFLFNIETGEQELLGNFPGMTFAPRFSPDGEKVLLAYENAGNSDVYVMDLRTRRLQRLTYSPAIDTSPSMAPDGRRLTFTSDRGGSPEIYTMNANGTDIRRISYGDGSYSTPVWSPRGDLIAFTRQYQGRFYIGVMRPDGASERTLTESFLDEGPTWAPNGRVLMFFRETPTRADGTGGGSKLWSVDLTGYNERRVTTPGDASDPAWSPLIQ
ncbi:MAG: Tol-Pal system beta propeller repeat protein TolB [Pseudomonadota bacterium]